MLYTSECDLTLLVGRGVQGYATTRRGRDNNRTGQFRTVPYQASAQFSIVNLDLLKMFQR